MMKIKGSHVAAGALLLSLAGCSLPSREKTPDITTSTPPAVSNPVTAKQLPEFKALETFLSEKFKVIDSYNAGSNMVVIISPETHARATSENATQAQDALWRQHFEDAGKINDHFSNVTLHLEGNREFTPEEFKKDAEFAFRAAGRKEKVTDEMIAQLMDSIPSTRLIKSSPIPVRGLEGKEDVTEITSLGSLAESYYSAKAKIVQTALDYNSYDISLPIEPNQTPEQLFQIDLLTRAKSACQSKAGKSFPIIPVSAVHNLRRVKNDQGEFLVLNETSVKAIAKACDQFFTWNDEYGLEMRSRQWAEKLKGIASQSGDSATAGFVVCGRHHVFSPEGSKAQTFLHFLKEKQLSYIVLEPLHAPEN